MKIEKTIVFWAVEESGGGYSIQMESKDLTSRQARSLESLCRIYANRKEKEEREKEDLEKENAALKRPASVLENLEKE